MPSGIACQRMPLFRELVPLRDKTARLLGYQNYLAFKAADKMVQTPETVTSLLAEIRQRTCPTSLVSVSELLAIKKGEAMARVNLKLPSTSRSLPGINPIKAKSRIKRNRPSAVVTPQSRGISNFTTRSPSS